jgi:hypothetical protein
MAKKITKYNTLFTRSLPPAVAQRDNLLEGVLASIVNGEYVPADFRASQGSLPARGFVVHSAQRRGGPLGTVTGYEARITIAPDAIVEDPDWNLLPGASYWLHTGGGIIAINADTATNDLRQYVGYAESATVLVGRLGDEVKHA